MKTIYAVLHKNKAVMAAGHNATINHIVEYDQHMIDKDIFISVILLNGFNMGGDTIVIYDWKKKRTAIASLVDEDSHDSHYYLRERLLVKKGKIYIK